MGTRGYYYPHKPQKLARSELKSLRNFALPRITACPPKGTVSFFAGVRPQNCTGFCTEAAVFAWWQTALWSSCSRAAPVPSGTFTLTKRIITGISECGEKEELGKSPHRLTALILMQILKANKQNKNMASEKLLQIYLQRKKNRALTRG